MALGGIEQGRGKGRHLLRVGAVMTVQEQHDGRKHHILTDQFLPPIEAKGRLSCTLLIANDSSKDTGMRWTWLALPLCFSVWRDHQLTMRWVVRDGSPAETRRKKSSKPP